MEKTVYLRGLPVQDDTEALQALLDGRGVVEVPGGQYCISDALIIHDDTRLILAQDAVICLADNACCYMLMNDRRFQPGRNRRIAIEGGVWDGNNLAQRRGKVYEEKPYFMGCIMQLAGLEDFTVRDVTYRNPEAYALQIRDADRFTVENITFDFNMLRLNMDGVHVNGPARNGCIRNIKGATNDDLVALNCDDGWCDFERYYVAQGGIENVAVDGLYADNGYTAVRLLSCGSRMRNINIRNVFGTYRFNGISFTHHSMVPGAPVWFDGIHIDGVYCSKPPQDVYHDPAAIAVIDDKYGAGTHAGAVRHDALIWFARGVTCGQVVISNVHRIEEAVTEAHTVRLDENVRVERLVLDNVTQRFVNAPEVPLISNEGQVDQMIQR